MANMGQAPLGCLGVVTALEAEPCLLHSAPVFGLTPVLDSGAGGTQHQDLFRRGRQASLPSFVAAGTAPGRGWDQVSTSGCRTGLVVEAAQARRHPPAGGRCSRLQVLLATALAQGLSPR